MRASSATDLKLVKENISYYKGDHFQFWVGPVIPSESDPKGEKMAQIRRVFQSCNLIAECVENARDGLISKPFVWYLKDASGDRVEASDAEAQLQRWMDWIEQQAIATKPEINELSQSDPWAEFVLSLLLCGEGNLRLWQPQKFADDPDPVHRYHLHAPAVGSVNVEYDDDGFIDWIEYTYGNGRTEKEKLEGNTLRITLNNAEEIEIDTGGRWTVQQVRSNSLLTPSIKQLQNSINHALTMKLRNQELSGFRERVFINCEPPGQWVEDPQSPSGQKFVPTATGLDRGPGYDNFIYGVPTGDSTSQDYAAGSIHESEPIDVSSYRDGIELDIALMYRMFKQGHLLGNSDNTKLSGESRIQMRQSFELFLSGYKRKVESAIANILNIVLKLLGYQNLEAVVKLSITTGKLSAEERRSIMDEYREELISKSTAIALLGSVEDVDAELALIEEEQQQQNAVQTVSSLTTAGLLDNQQSGQLLQRFRAIPDDVQLSDPNRPLNP